MARAKTVARTALNEVSAAQLTRIAGQVGPFTEADLAPYMPEARATHAETLAGMPGTPPLALDLTEWAVLAIAANRYARAHGYDPGADYNPTRWRTTHDLDD